MITANGIRIVHCVATAGYSLQDTQIDQKFNHKLKKGNLRALGCPKIIGSKVNSKVLFQLIGYVLATKKKVQGPAMNKRQHSR